MNSEETKPGKTEAIIPADVEVQGQIKCSGNIQIDGKLNGDLSCAGHAAIGGNAVINGNLAVDSITVSGRVTGNITAKDRIDLKATTRLTGDIKAKRLTVEDGVTFVGKSEVNSSGAAAGGADSSAGQGYSSAVAADDMASERAVSDNSSTGQGAVSYQDQKKGKSGVFFGRK